MMKKSLFLLLAVTMCFCVVFSSCKKNTADSASDSAGSDTAAVQNAYNSDSGAAKEEGTSNSTSEERKTSENNHHRMIKQLLLTRLKKCKIKLKQIHQKQAVKSQIIRSLHRRILNLSKIFLIGMGEKLHTQIQPILIIKLLQ